MAAVGLLMLGGSRRAEAQNPAVVNAETIRVKFENDRARRSLIGPPVHMILVELKQ